MLVLCLTFKLWTAPLALLGTAFRLLRGYCPSVHLNLVANKTLRSPKYEKSILRRALKHHPWTAAPELLVKVLQDVEDVSIYIYRQRHGIIALSWTPFITWLLFGLPLSHVILPYQPWPSPGPHVALVLTVLPSVCLLNMRTRIQDHKQVLPWSDTMLPSSPTNVLDLCSSIQEAQERPVWISWQMVRDLQSRL